MDEKLESLDGKGWKKQYRQVNSSLKMLGFKNMTEMSDFQKHCSFRPNIMKSKMSHRSLSKKRSTLDFEMPE